MSFSRCDWLFPLSAREVSLGTVLIINLLGKGLTPRACMGDGGSIRWAPEIVYFTQPELCEFTVDVCHVWTKPLGFYQPSAGKRISDGHMFACSLPHRRSLGLVICSLPTNVCRRARHEALRTSAWDASSLAIV